MLKDIAILTGGTVDFRDSALTSRMLQWISLVVQNSVKVQKENTIIVDGLGDKKAIADRVAQIKVRSKRQNPTLTERNLQERLAKLAWRL